MESPARSDRSLDHQLLVCVEALRAGLIDHDQLVALMGRWMAASSPPLPQLLLESGLLTREALEMLARRARGLDAAMAMADQETVEIGSAGAPGAPVGSGGDAVSTEEPGRYRIGAEQGRGGQSRVLLAYDSFVGRAVALKELLPDGSASSWGTGGVAVADRFLREARVTGQLEHPAIVPVYEVGRRVGGTLYYTMKLVRGRTLAAALAEAGTLAARLKLLGHFVDLCQAVAYAHSRGFVHRDLKPENVMVGEFGETVVLDWGLAKRKGDRDDPPTDGAHHPVDAPVDRTVAGTILGTPRYMSPEQALGSGDAAEDASDIYSLGAILHAILTGSPPFTGTQGREVVAALQRYGRGQMELPAPVLRDDRPPAELMAVARKALGSRAADRYATARELADEVEAYMTGGRVAAHAYTFRETALRLLSRYRGQAVVAAVAIAVLLVTGAYAFVRVRGERDAAKHQRGLAERSRDEAERRGDEAHRRLLRLLEEQGKQELLAGNVTRSLVYLAETYRQGNDRPHVRALLTRVFQQIVTRERTLPGNPSVVRGVAIDPGGRRLVSVGADGMGRLFDLATGAGPVSLAGHGAAVWLARFDPGGQRFLTASADGTARLWDAATGAPLVTIVAGTAEGEQVIAAEWSPDGTRVAVALGVDKFYDSRRGRWSASIWDAETGSERARLSGHEMPLTDVAWRPDGRSVATSGLDGVCLHRVDGGEPPVRCTSEPTLTVAWSLDGTRLAAGETDGTLRLLDGRSGRPLLAIPAHAREIWSVAFSPDGGLIVSASADGTARLSSSDGSFGFRLVRRQPAAGITSSVGQPADYEMTPNLSSNSRGVISTWRGRTPSARETMPSSSMTSTRRAARP